MTLRAPVVFVLALCISRPGVAQTPSVSAQPTQVPTHSRMLEKCLNDPMNIYPVERNICVAQEVERKDQEITKIVNRKAKWILSNKNDTGASQELKKAQARWLRASQKDWLRYRESWCQYVSDMIVGTGSPGTYVYCKLEFSEKRIAHLNETDG